VEKAFLGVEAPKPPLYRAASAAVLLAAAALTLYAYRDLPGRPFAADDFQWLLNVHGLSWGEVTARAFDAGAQTHFFRPLVWLLFWAQTRAFGLDPAPFHAVSLALHLLNSALLGLLAVRSARCTVQSATASLYPLLFALCTLFVALHPAPFEAVVWVSGQSELLAALLLLVALHLWLPGAPSTERRTQNSLLLLRVLLATLALGLALLAKESAVIGLGLLFLLGPPLRDGVRWQRFLPFALPLAVTGAYLVLQQQILAQNEIIRGAGYGIGPQLLLNPLRTLGLVAAPLPGTQYGDLWWLPWAGAGVIGFWMLDFGLMAARRHFFVGTYLRLALAVLLTLLPTAPFASSPDSRYVYLTVMAVAALLGIRFAGGIAGRAWPSLILPLAVVLIALAWWSTGELAAREGRFAAASGPGGSLWRLVQGECAAARLSRVVVVEPPLAPPHAEAIVRLACGADVLPVVVGRDGVEDALRPNAIVVAFPGGGAQVEQREGQGGHSPP
jgi:hypothetical protein